MATTSPASGRGAATASVMYRSRVAESCSSPSVPIACALNSATNRSAVSGRLRLYEVPRVQDLAERHPRPQQRQRRLQQPSAAVRDQVPVDRAKGGPKG